MRSVLIAVLLLLCVPRCARAADQKTYPVVNVTINKTAIHPGDPVAQVLSVVGPPDEFKAQRGKEPSQDYIDFRYINSGMNFHIANSNNTVQGILVTQPDTKLQGVPVKVGDTIGKLKQLWGDPDNAEKSVYAYWYRGVYASTDAQGRIVNFFLVVPGKLKP